MLQVVARPLVLITTFVTVGCACPTVRTVIPLREPSPRDLGWMGSERRLPFEECKALCGESRRLQGCTVHQMRTELDGENKGPTGRALVCETISSCPGGRAPSGVDLSAPVRAASHEGAFWAGVARMEAVSIGSFLRLARELRAHDAPPALIDRAHHAAREEHAHATAMARLAARLGAELPEVPVVSLEVRAFDAVALENEVEGCVHERWSAAVVAHQAHARSELRSVLQPVAIEESEHAQLSLELARWFRDRGGARLTRELDAAREQARSRLLASLVEEPAAESLGLPSGARAHALATTALA